MNWFSELCDLYEKNQDIAGIMGKENTALLPLFHTTVTAQIEVTIDRDGNFLRAEIVPEEDKLTIIPVTEKSASRTAGIEPHPLCDNLKYLAGDYGLYVTEKDCSQKHKLFMEQLKNWVESDFSHEKAEAIYRYLQKGTLVRDLCDRRVLETDDNGRLLPKVKIHKIVSQTDSFVRFRIETGELPPEDILEEDSGCCFAECWKDRTLHQSYIDYCRSRFDSYGMSYLTGETTQISYLQPKKIRNEGDGAKLISANDAENYTYRGRFVSREEAFAVGYEESQKAHNALKWIIRNQGGSLGGLCIVTWESDLNKVPDWQDDTDTICRQAEEAGWEAEEWPTADQPDTTDCYEGTGAADAARFQSALRGYQSKLGRSSHTMIMAFDAATTGRLAMVECRDYLSSRYLESLEKWRARCEWRHPKAGKDRGRYIFYGMVSTRDAAELLYGVEQNGFFSMKGKEELYKEVARRWLPCILDGREIPVDMVRKAVQRASEPMIFESRFLWERILALACSLVKQQYKIKLGEDWTMALDETSHRRDYLYGRLLAVADRVEYRTFEKDEKRETNAKRYMCAFSQHPFRTWKILEEKLTAYWPQLEVKERGKYRRDLDDIFALFAMEDFEKDTALDGLYLLGFHNQAQVLKEFKVKEEETK